MQSNPPPHFNLVSAAHAAMVGHGFKPDFPQGTDAELSQILSDKAPPSASVTFTADFRDLRSLQWSSIDNDTSKDLDQIEWAERLSDGLIRVLVAVADVDSRVKVGTVIDTYARGETTSVYTGVKVFPMLPPELSEGITSLNENEERAAIVLEYCVDQQGAVSAGKSYRALVRNRGQLAYNAVGAWLEGRGPAPAKVAANRELAAQLKLQDEAAQRLAGNRFQHGALDLETVETHPVLEGAEVVNLARLVKNRATSLIEEFMVAANGVMARGFDAAKVASIRRIVRTPKRWDRIVELAGQHGGKLPADPDSKALNDFLQVRRQADPEHFADVSLAVVKLMGPGEYVLVKPAEPDPGHFGLAVEDYTHSTAPNRRFPDMVAQRILKAMLTGAKQPYSEDDLNAIAQRSTEMGDQARKVEREMQKRIAAVVLHPRIGQNFNGIVTGVNEHGTFARSLDPPVDGMIVSGAKGLDVGDRVTLKLINTDPARGFIDFKVG